MSFAYLSLYHSSDVDFTQEKVLAMPVKSDYPLDNWEKASRFPGVSRN